MATNIPIVFCFSPESKAHNSSVSAFLGVPVTELSQRPVYVRNKRVMCKIDPNTDMSIWNAMYISLFWQSNPGYKLLGCIPVGSHPADVEKLVILSNPQTGTPRWVYFSAHGKGEGVWKKWEDCEFEAGTGALKVYIAPTSNAFYPHAGRYIRIFGFANDVCQDSPIHYWRPRSTDFTDATLQSWSSTHYQVHPGINSPMNTPDPVQTSITPHQRFFLALPFVKKLVKSQPQLQILPNAAY